jgi:hypothetical protein
MFSDANDDLTPDETKKPGRKASVLAPLARQYEAALAKLERLEARRAKLQQIEDDIEAQRAVVEDARAAFNKALGND